MKKRVIIEPLSGLCNRMRAIASTYTIAQKLGYSCIIFWGKTRDCCCKFSDLFEPNPGIPVVTYRKNNKLQYLLYLIWNRFFRMITAKKFSDTEVLINNKPRADVETELFGGESVYIQSSFSLQGNTTQVYRTLDWSCLRFRPELQKKAAEVTRSLGAHSVGVHIRRTDHGPAIACSPLDTFIDQMDARLAAVPDTVFYLATDDAQVKDQLRQRYGDKICTYEAELIRDSVQGMKDAAVELLCLSRTTEIWGSYWSSYSEIAAILGNIEHRVVLSDPTI